MKYIIRRVLVCIPVLLGLTIIVFGMVHLLPGDPAATILADSGAKPDAVAKLRAQLGLDLPLHQQYLNYMGDLLHGNMGSSLFTYRPVTEIIGQNIGSTIELALTAIVIAVIVGLVLGILGAIYQDSWIDNLTMTVAVVGVSMPMFWSALLLILLFSLALGWLPSGGQGSFKHLILPATVLGFNSSAVIARLVRSTMLEVLRQEYITTARAKGLTARVIFVRHALRNALIPVVTVAGLQFGFLLGGTVVTETVFARQGLGRIAVDAITYKDLPIVQGVVLMMAIVYMLVNLIVDLTYSVLDPRIRYQ